MQVEKRERSKLETEERTLQVKEQQEKGVGGKSVRSQVHEGSFVVKFRRENWVQMTKVYLGVWALHWRKGEG